MNKIYPKNSLGYKILNHDNNYHFNLFKKIEKPKKLSSLSVIIPYHESRKTINITLTKLFNAFKFVKNKYPDWKFEVLLIDDGSIKYPIETILKKSLLNKLKVYKHPINLGITQSRNDGLKFASSSAVMFMDSDIFIPEDMIYEHLLIYSRNSNIISFSLFHFIDYEEWRVKTNKQNIFNSPNDWRIDCVYQKNWIGCPDDKQFINMHFQIMKETNYLKDWPKNGSLGPWIITNMVNGGLFCVNRNKAITVKGFSSMFGKYGFVETSLVTKLVSECKSFIIPVINSFAIDIYNKEASHSKDKRDQLFRKAHKLYFEKFLFLKYKEINDKKL